MFKKVEILLILLLLKTISSAQTPDTLLVFEDVHITDTVWIEEPSVRDTTQFSRLESLKPELFSSNTATISETGIYTVNNQKQAEMKKAGLIAGMLLTFQTISFGQAEFSVIAGPSIMGIEHWINTINNPVWEGGNMGIEFTIPTKYQLSFTTGATGRFQQPTGPYKQIRAVDESLSYLEQDWLKINTNAVLFELNSGLLKTSYLQFAIPIKLNLNKGKLRFFTGMAYNYTSFNYELPGTYSPEQTTYLRKKTNFSNLDALLGMKMQFKRHLGISIELDQDLFSIHNYFNDNFYPNLGDKEYYFRKWNLDFCMVYTF